MFIRYMKELKIIGAMCFLVLHLLGFTSCGLSDWGYSDLPNNYELWRINCNRIVLGKADGDSSSLETCIDQYVLEFCNNDTYIGAMCRPYIETREWDQEDFDLYDAEISYYLVDTSNDEVHGPYTLDEYEKCIEELEIDNLCDWIKTVPRPKGAK